MDEVTADPTRSLNASSAVRVFRGWAAENGLNGASYAELVEAPAVREMIDEYIAKLNAELNRWETIKKWALLDHDLSIDRGELTPSLKVKRSVVAEQNKNILDGFYS